MVYSAVFGTLVLMKMFLGAYGTVTISRHGVNRKSGLSTGERPYRLIIRGDHRWDMVPLPLIF